MQTVYWVAAMKEAERTAPRKLDKYFRGAVHSASLSLLYFRRFAGYTAEFPTSAPKRIISRLISCSENLA